MRVGVAIAVALAAFGLQAAWYWPFAPDLDSTNRPPRLHRLLEKANDFIELAEDEASKGEAEKALDFYRQALDELTRVQLENPDRAETPEFAPLRNKMAACRAAVDAIRFDQIASNVRAVSVTDTDALQRKWNKKHGLAETVDPPAAPGVPAAPDAPDAPLPPPAAAALKRAAAALSSGEADAAEEQLEALAASYGGYLNVRLLQAAAQAARGRFYAARKTLMQAAADHPGSYMPHYNLAYVALQLGEGRKAARASYEQGRELGGPANKDLEARLAE